MYISASSRCFSADKFEDACRQLTDLEYDRIEIWFDSEGNHLDVNEVSADPDAFVAKFRDMTRMTPIAFCLDHEISPQVLSGLTKLAKLLRVTQITIPASELGTPFNSEIDRLRALLTIASEDGIRLSIKTKTGHLTEDPHTAVELCQAVRGLGLTLDASYYICGPYKDQTYDQVFPHVYHTQLRDTTPGQFQVQTGLGEVDFSKLIAQLARQDYKQALSVEIHPELLDGADRSLELRKIRMLLETLL